MLTRGVSSTSPHVDIVRSRRHLAALALITAAVLVWPPAPVSAHARLETTDPAAGETVSEAPETIQLTYSEPIEESFSGVQVFAPTGDRVDEGTPTIVGPDTTVPIGSMTVPGTYTVVFRVIGADGHPVESRYTFIFQPEVTPTPTATPIPTAIPTLTATPTPSPIPTSSSTPPPSSRESAVATPTRTPTPAPSNTATSGIDDDEAGEEVALVDPAPTVDPASFELQDAGSGTDIGLLISRVLDYGALVLLAGSILGAGWILATDQRATRRLRRTVTAAGIALALGAGLVFLFGLSAAAAEPLPQALSASVVSRFAGTRFGLLVAVQGALGLGIALVSGVVRSRAGLWAAGAVALLAAALPGFWGHAGTTDPVPLAVAVDWSHVVGAAAWMGSLGVLGLVALKRAPSGVVDPSLRVSRLAGVALWVVLVSGVGSALLHVGTIDQLTETGYGRLVIAKAVLFVVIAAMGWRNRSVAIPRMRRAVAGADTGLAVSAFRRFVLVEVVVMMLALGVAGGLASSVPAKADAASRVEFLAAELTDEVSVNVTIEPAKPGRNLMHFYILGSDGRPRQVDGATMELANATTTISVDLIVSGPGHYTALGQLIPEAGEYLMEMTVDLDGATRTATGTVIVQ